MSSAQDKKGSPWWERHPAIFLREAESARKRGFRLTVERSGSESGSGRMVARGRIRVKAARPGEREKGHGFNVEAVYPDSFPFDKLDIRPRDERIRRRRHQVGSGDLCYTQEELAPWELGDGLDRAVENAEDWFHGEVTGRFEREVPATELLFYLERDTSRTRALLIPGHAIWARPPAAAGEIDIEWDGRPNGITMIGAYRRFKETVPAALRESVRKTNDRLWKAVGRTGKVARKPGVWFSLDREPRPFRNLAELEEVLAGAGVPSERFRRTLERQLGSEVRRGGWLPVGLEYPRDKRGDQDTGPEREWLFISVEWPKLPENLRKGKRLRTGVFWTRYAIVKGIPSYPVRPEDLRRRVGGLYPTEPLEKTHVVMVGAGALGSPVARAIVAAGVGRITVVEPDTMKPGNVVRHEARMPDVGLLKADAMERILIETNPYVQVEKVHGTRFDRKKFEEILRDPRHPPTLIIAATANRAVEGQVDEAASRCKSPPPVLHAWLQAQAQVLRAFLYVPGTTACTYCNQYYAADGDGFLRVPDELADEPFFEASCASPAFPGAGNANALAAHVVGEMALDVLHGRLREAETHWVFAGNRVEERVPDFPVKPLSIARSGFTPHPRCPVCSERVLSPELDEEERAQYDQELARATGSTKIGT